VEGAAAVSKPLGQEDGFATGGAQLPPRQSGRQSILQEEIVVSFCGFVLYLLSEGEMGKEVKITAVIEILCCNFEEIC